jgi:4-hydroxybenzoate polyprenyltransferase
MFSSSFNDRERDREIERERERESGAVGATSTPSTVGLFSFLTILFLPTFSQH